MSEWKTYKLGEIAEIIMGQSPLGETCSEDNIGTPLLNGPTEFGTHKPIAVQFTTDPKKISEVNDILFCVRGSTTGKMNWSDKRYAIGRGLAAIRHKGGIDFRYFLKGIIDFNLKNILGLATGSTFPNIGGEQLREFIVDVPDLHTQTQIAQILSSLDDKIELNLQMNQTLEAMAQALFKEWFVDFNFPGFDGELVDGLPKGWRIGKLSNVCVVKYGKDHKHLEEGNIPVYGSGGIMRFADKALFEQESILIPRKGTLTNLFYVSKPFWSVDTMFYTVIKEDYIRKYLYYLLKSLNLASMNVGSAVPSLTTEVLNKIDIIIPEKNVLINFEQVVSTFYTKMEENNNQIQILTHTRDALLPKLMSGKINIKE